MRRLLICGTSTRAAAASAARAGFSVTALDAFADVDQEPSVRALSASRDFGVSTTASAMARATQALDADAVVYLSPFENHPRAVSRLAAGRSLWGNSPETLRRIRNPYLLAETLRRHGFATPRFSNDSNDPNDPNDSWLLKPFRSGGGHRIRPWRGEPVPSQSYLQERLDGTPGSLIFVAAGGDAVPLGFSRQLVGDPAFGAAGYRYCGSILASLDDAQFVAGGALFDAAVTIARLLASEFGLVGLNGLDFIARDGIPVVLEVNPRWSSSAEVAERAFRTILFSAHAEACAVGALPSFDCSHRLQRSAAVGKAIVYAQHNGVVVDSSTWLDDPDVGDVPRSGERVRAGQPICSVFATAPDSSACYRALVARAERIYATVQRGTAVRAVTAAG